MNYWIKKENKLKSLYNNIYSKYLEIDNIKYQCIMTVTLKLFKEKNIYIKKNV